MNETRETLADIEPERVWKRRSLTVLLGDADRVEIHRDVVILSSLRTRSLTLFHVDDFTDVGLPVPEEKPWP